MPLGQLLYRAYRDRTVVVTGHTGFKGSWLCEWLLALGAKVVGIALPPEPNHLFVQLGLEERVEHVVQDIREPDALARLIPEIRPDYVFHLAAQALVRPSYSEPVGTYATNVMGTVHVLEGLRKMATVAPMHRCAGVIVTTDKCYENHEWLNAYREGDPLGGRDPYSSSKAAAELVVAAYRRSYFSNRGSVVALASARAGNVLGGGDWAKDRIVPDCVRSLRESQPILVRNPSHTRPWQHVLEPLSGYLLLAHHARTAMETNDEPRLAACSCAFNFGPSIPANQSVRALVEQVLNHWPGSWLDASDPRDVHEAGRLSLAWDLAYHVLGWSPTWDFSETIARTITWYKSHHDKTSDAATLTRRDIGDYEESAQVRAPH